LYGVIDRSCVCRGGGSALSWQCVPLSRLAWPVNRQVQCIIIKITALYRITALYYTSRLTGNTRRDNGTRFEDRLSPPRTQQTMHTLATITINQQNRHPKQLVIQRQLYRRPTCIYSFTSYRPTFASKRLWLHYR